MSSPSCYAGRVIVKTRAGLALDIVPELTDQEVLFQSFILILFCASRITRYEGVGLSK
ncbi:hypothetical protein IFR04_013214 [Cadophora malorum]|uniref:Uncharacterized protein n=1 Tax=Cadophora malorum TaxID=108018 RepID=A0A8H7W0R5_9HELO|nr:hypothetical protein IFR04_013214 [Cadophora malorum]